MADLTDDAGLHWSPWVPLTNCSQGTAVPAQPDLYHIRRVGLDSLDYIGQRGVSLRRRLGMLKGVWGIEMPYRDPHTAGPGRTLLSECLRA